MNEGNYTKYIDLIKKQYSYKSDGVNILIKHDTKIIKDLHFDSLDMVELIMNIEKLFQIYIPDDAIDLDITVESLYYIIIQKLDE